MSYYVFASRVVQHDQSVGDVWWKQHRPKMWDVIVAPYHTPYLDLLVIMGAITDGGWQ